MWMNKCIYLLMYVYVYTFKKHAYRHVYICIYFCICIRSYNSHRQCQWVTRLILAFILCIFVTLPWLRGPCILVVLHVPPSLLYPPHCDQHLSHHCWHILWSCSSGSCHSTPLVNDWPICSWPSNSADICRCPGRFSLVTPLPLTQALSLPLGCKGWGCCPCSTKGYSYYKAQVPYFKHS